MNGIRELHTVKLGFQGELVNEILEEVNSLLEFDVEINDAFPLELRQQFLGFLESPENLFNIDSKVCPAEGANNFVICLKPSDSCLEFLLALRAWDRKRKVAV